MCCEWEMAEMVMARLAGEYRKVKIQTSAMFDIVVEDGYLVRRISHA